MPCILARHRARRLPAAVERCQTHIVPPPFAVVVGTVVEVGCFESHAQLVQATDEGTVAKRKDSKNTTPICLAWKIDERARRARNRRVTNLRD